MGEKEKLIRRKRKTFRGTEEIVEYFLDSLKRCKVIGGLSGKNFDAGKIFQYSKQRKETPKQHESISTVQTPANPRAELLIQERKEFEKTRK